MSDLQLTDVTVIADNAHGWRFCVARCGDRWLGFAAPERSPSEKAFAGEGLPVSPQMLMVLPQVSEDFQMGLRDRDKAIRMTGAIAQDPEAAYGGVDRWFVPEDLRGKPDDFRCGHCDQVGCDGRECEQDYADSEEEFFP